MATYKESVRTYEEAQKFLGLRDARTIGHNTRLERRDDGAISVKYHNSPVVIYAPGGTMLNSCGWRTMTTKERINSFCPPRFDISQEHGTWFLHDHQNHNFWTFADGIIIDGSGQVSNAGAANEAKENIKLAGRIRTYAKNYASALVAGKIPEPASGDCWYCYLVAEDGSQVGGYDHLLTHLEENYLVPSLLMRAIKSRPICAFAMSTLGCLWNKFPERKADDVTDWEKVILTRDVIATITHYLRHELGLAS